MPAIVQLDLSQVLTSADEFICRWIELPTSVRTIAAFENLLRGKQLGGQLQGGSLRFLRAGGIVIDTACLIGDLIEVVAACRRGCCTQTSSGGSGPGSGQQTVRRERGWRSARPQAAQSDAAATDWHKEVQQQHQQQRQEPQRRAAQQGMRQLGRHSDCSAGLSDC